LSRFGSQFGGRNPGLEEGPELTERSLSGFIEMDVDVLLSGALATLEEQAVESCGGAVPGLMHTYG
jgi:hypothetical protein